jgi:hypothetical protein
MVAKLHAVGAPKPPALVASPERARLREVIQRHNEAVAALGQLQSARERAPDPFGFHDAIEAAEEAVALAQSNEPARLVDALIDGTDVSAGASPVADAEAALRSLESERQRAVDIRSLLDEREREARRRIEWVQSNLRAAVADVLKSSAEVERLFAEHDAAQRRVAEIVHCIRSLPLAAIPETRRLWNAIRTDGEYPSAPSAAAWRSAVAALQTDPDAALPELSVTRIERVIVDPDPPPLTAA